MSPAKSTLTTAQQVQLVTQAEQQGISTQIAMLGRAQTLLAQRASDLQKTAPASELKRRIAHYQNVSGALNDARLAAVASPPPSPDSFILYGRVVDSSGKPQKDVTVSLSDAKGTVNTRVSPVQTDANGFYTFTLRAAEFSDLVQAKTEIFVSVTNANHQELAKPTQSVIMQPGKVAVLPIVTKSRVR